MAMLSPFRGLRPPVALVREIAAAPYDVVTRAQAAALAEGNPRCFFRISRPELELGPDVDEHDPRVYLRGRENLQRFVSEGWLGRDERPSFYLYRQRMGSHAQLGLVAVASVDEYERNEIRRHENTRTEKELDRTNHIDAVAANDEPVFLTYRSRPEVDALLAEGANGAPEYDFTSDDGVEHTFWIVPHALSDRIASGLQSVKSLYIADGHHRAAAAARVRERRRERGLGPGAHDSFLAVVFPHTQLQILGYHRAVRDLNGMSERAFLERVSNDFDVSEITTPEPSRARELAMYLAKCWYRLRLKASAAVNGSATAARTAKAGDATMASDTATEREPELRSGAVASLDVSMLQEFLLSPVLGIHEPRTDPRLHFVGGIRGVRELERLVDGGTHAVAFALHPPDVEQMMAVADTGEVMPPKSTWFEPKLRSGLVLHPFD